MTIESPDPPPIASDAAPSTVGEVSTADRANVSPPLGVKRRSRRSRRLVIIIGGVVILACLAGIVSFFGQVSGREFAPSHFETRDFSFVEIPILRLQITPIRRTTRYSALAAYLSTSSLILRPQGPPAQWHLVQLSRVAVSTLPADAKLLTDYLEQLTLGGTSTATHYWHQWSIDQPAMAAVLWPEIQKLAQRELYLLIPDVFRIADRSTSADALAEELRTFIASSYADIIKDLQAAGQTELAEAFLTEAKADYPDDPRWQQL